jgi:hypothetical protein
MLIKSSHVAIGAVVAIVAVSICGYLVWTRYGGGYVKTSVPPYGGATGGPYGSPGGPPYGGASGGTYGSPAAPPYGGSSGGTYGSPAAPPYGGFSGGTYGSPAATPYGGASTGTYGNPGGHPYDGTYGPGGTPYGGTYGSPGAPPYGGASDGTFGPAPPPTYGGATGGTYGRVDPLPNSAAYGGPYARTDPGPYGGSSGATYGTGATAGGLEDTPYDPVINPRDFVSRVSNRYFRLIPGSIFTYEKRTPAGTERSEVEVTREKRRVMGVLTTVVRHTTWLNGQLKEISRDWYAQDRRGNVWYFGEEVDNYENGRLKDHAGSWEAGVNGAKPGIVMLNDPLVGLAYRQESYKGHAEDAGAVIAVNRTVTVPSGTFRGCVQTRNWSSIDRTENEYKYYCPQVGFLALEEAATQGGASAQLVSVSTPAGNVFNGQGTAYGRRGDD